MNDNDIFTQKRMTENKNKVEMVLRIFINDYLNFRIIRGCIFLTHFRSISYVPLKDLVVVLLDIAP